MSFAVPLTIRLKSARKDSDITKEVAGFKFRSEIPGGYASAQFTLNRPLDYTPEDVRYFAKIFIYDGRSGATVWEGELEDPGRGLTDSGEIWSITAVGGMAHTKDETFPIIYVDKSLENWVKSKYSQVQKSKLETTELPDTTTPTDDGVPCLLMTTEVGTTITNQFIVDAIYRHPWNIGQKIARIRADVVAGVSTSQNQTAIVTRVAGGAANSSTVRNFSTTPGVTFNNFGNGLPIGDNVVSLRFQRAGSASAVAVAGDWVAFYGISVRCSVFNADGTENFSLVGYNVNNIDPVEVVADLLGRKLTNVYDGANAVLIGSGVDITQLAYQDGTTVADILQDLEVFDPGFYWAVWETNPANGKYRFEYVPWGNQVRYEADTFDGFNSPGSAADLYNSVDVQWRNQANKLRHTVRTQNVPELTEAGITRQFYINISDELGDLENAQYIGDNFLAEHRYPPNAGTLNVQRPILDNMTGRMVWPHEILPGHLIRVRGVAPRVDSLNPTNRDGVTVFRVISVEYDAESATATLELDSYSRTVARALADLTTTRLRKR